MSLETLRRLSRAYYSEDQMIEDELARDSEIRSRLTPPAQLKKDALSAFHKCCQTLATSLAYRPHGYNAPALEFSLELDTTDIIPDDVMKRVIEMFGERGFEGRHRHSVGVNTYEILQLTAPPDWAERILRRQPARRRRPS